LSAAYPIFQSFIQAGFECSTHKLRTGRRLDLLASTQHDRFAREDYRRIQALGIRTARVGARWHLIEPNPGRYNFDSLAIILDAAAETETEVLLDVLHFGWPDHVDVFTPSFVSQVASYTLALTQFLKTRGDTCNMFAPVNEISFLAWAGGDKGAIHPCSVGRGHELKRNLIRVAIASSQVLLGELPNCRLIFPEPVIHIVGNPAIEGDAIEAEAYSLAQFQAWDMLCGKLAPELGGAPHYLDIIGVNFYEQNEWVHNSTTLARDDPRYRPLHKLIQDVWARYRRPMFISETGTEDGQRAEWFNYVCDEVRIALKSGIPVQGICLYPILNHPGWDNDRHCHNGLFDYADASGNRHTYWPLAQAILAQLPKLPAWNNEPTMSTNNIDLLCMSHLRWGFVFQRPQHLMSRFARTRRVFFFEEPIFDDTEPHLRSSVCPKTGVHVQTPILPCGLNHQQIVELQRSLLRSMIQQNHISDYIAWYYTPMAREFASDLKPAVTIYDCMDELSAFAGAAPAMRANEEGLFRDADLVFTGGASLFESKRKQHSSVHLFPSSVDIEHFAQARSIKRDPEDQHEVPHPLLGYAGVIDERMDLELLRKVAAERPDWQIILLGPVVKIHEASLPKAANIHYLGMKQYSELPGYLSGWEIGMLPFALNDSTRFISPTKTPEYLAAGLRVVSTPIRDVVTPYGDLGLVAIANGAREFIRAVESLLHHPPDLAFRARVDQFLSQSSWDKTWGGMNELIENTLVLKRCAVRATPGFAQPTRPVMAARDISHEGAAHV
jgi:glycosyltransferase involved in cell wall biosynthesis